MVLSPIVACVWTFFRYREREVVFDWATGQVTWRVGKRVRHASLTAIGSQEGIWYTATVLNDGPALPAVYIQGEIHQGSAIGGAGGTLIECTLTEFGPLPTGTCVTRLTAVAGADVGLQPGSATLVVYIYREVNGEVEEFDRVSVAITLK